MRTQFKRRRLSRATLPAFIMALPLGGACARADTPTPASPGSVVVLEPRAAPFPESVADVPAALLRPGATFTLAQVVDLALANSPLTRTSYRRARSEAANLGSKRGAYFPTIDASASALRGRQPTSDQQGVVTYTTYGPALTLNYLLLDFGGRGAQVEEARQSLLAADWSHNTVIHDVALGVQQAYFQYQGAKALLVAARTTLKQAQTSLDASSVRHDAGVATIADVLQARTALAQAQLNVDGFEGQVFAVRGALATAMGLPANLAFDVGSLPSEVPLERAQPTIDALIADARLRRPELAALRAQARKAEAHVGVVRAEGLPSLSLQAGANRTYLDSGPLNVHHDLWSARVQLSVPVFSGFSKTYNVRRAREDAAVARAQAEGYEQQVILQVWTSYYALQTASQRVRTSQALLESATQSEQVALARYKEGVGTVLDLLSAQAALASARAQEIQARADWLVSVAGLAHDSGALPRSNDVTIVTEEK
jgi:outer membrane protein TolC